MTIDETTAHVVPLPYGSSQGSAPPKGEQVPAGCDLLPAGLRQFAKFLDENPQTTTVLRRLVDTHVPEGAHAPKRGRPAQYEWDLFWTEILAYSFKHELPEKPADLENHMSDWCANNWQRTPTSSVLREKISLIYRNPIFRSHRRA